MLYYVIFIIAMFSLMKNLLIGKILPQNQNWFSWETSRASKIHIALKAVEMDGKIPPNIKDSPQNHFLVRVISYGQPRNMAWLEHGGFLKSILHQTVIRFLREDFCYITDIMYVSLLAL